MSQGGVCAHRGRSHFCHCREKDLKRALELSRQAASTPPPSEPAAQLSASELVETAEDDEDDSSDESATGWTSSEDESEEEEATEIETEETRRQRVMERLRVLEAAGVIVRNEDEAADGEDENAAEGSAPMRRRSTVRRKPEAPERRKTVRRNRSKSALKPRPERPLPPPPAPVEPEKQIDDAYDRFQRMAAEVSLSQETSAAAVTSPKRASRRTSAGPGGSATPPMPSSPPPESASAGSSRFGAGEGRTSHFLSTIKGLGSRRGAASPAERKATPTISGPMALGSPSLNSLSSDVTEGGSAAEQAAMTTSGWASTVPAEVLSSLSDKERKRQEAIFEFIATESTHVRDLQIIVEVFFNEMHASGLLSAKASRVVFANVEEVLLAAVSLLSDLETRQRMEVYVSSISDILARHMPAMQVYLPYCVNQTSAAQILQSERQRNPAIDAQLQTLRREHPAARGLDLSSFLLIPSESQALPAGLGRS